MANTLIAMRTWLATRWLARDEDRGASLVEYALLIVLIAVVCVIAVTILGESTSEGFSSTASGFG